MPFLEKITWLHEIFGLEKLRIEIKPPEIQVEILNLYKALVEMAKKNSALEGVRRKGYAAYKKVLGSKVYKNNKDVKKAADDLKTTLGLFIGARIRLFSK